MGEKAIEYARCMDSDLEPVTIMRHLSSQAILSLLRRFDIEYEEGLPKEAYLIAWQEEFCKNRDHILHIFPKEYLHFLLEIWDSKEVSMDPYHWEILDCLRAFGILTYKKGNIKLGEEHEIHVSELIKNQFYFFLKGKDSQKQMDMYDRWESAFLGMSYYYGMITLPKLYELSCKVLKHQIPFSEFLSFIHCRADVWGAGQFLMDGNGMEYFKNNSVENAEITYVYLKEHGDLPHKQIAFHDLEYIKNGFGVDNRWAGLTDLGNYLVNDLEVSYYRASVLVHTLLTSIQNSKSFDYIKEKLDFILDETEGKKEKAEEYLLVMYENTPIYEYKGHTRSEYKKICDEKQWKNIRKRFTMIEGGKC